MNDERIQDDERISGVYTQTQLYSIFGSVYLKALRTTMGANFAPSFVNLFMGFWEEAATWRNNPYSKNLVSYGRYIDDIIIIWQGDQSTVDMFQHLL